MVNHWIYRGIQYGDGTTKRALPLRFSAINPRGFVKKHNISGVDFDSGPKKRKTTKPRKHHHSRSSHKSRKH